MKLSDAINPSYLDPRGLSEKYQTAVPFPHIVLDDFIQPNLIEAILTEFPDLSLLTDGIVFKDQKETKYASKGFQDISDSAVKLIGLLNSDLFLHYLNELTGIDETLIADPYLAGGGYHEIKNGGVLKVHVDFNKHPSIDLDRRINLLLYLNKDWNKDWGGSLELYDEAELAEPAASITPEFNRCVIFSTDSHSYHGHPEPINCPEDRSRKSLALYYFSNGRPEREVNSDHTTIFVETKGEVFATDSKIKKIVVSLLPPIIYNALKKLKG